MSEMTEIRHQFLGSSNLSVFVLQQNLGPASIISTEDGGQAADGGWR